MKQKHRTIPPDDDATSPPRILPRSCDERAQKYVFGKISKSSLPVSRFTTLEKAPGAIPTASIPEAELGQETLARAAGEGKGITRSGEKAVADGVPIRSSAQSPTLANRANAQKLRRRYLDPDSHSFPTYGNPKTGVPISTPMGRDGLRNLLGGDFQTKNNIDSKGLDSLSKRPAQSQKTRNEQTRSSKRQKTLNKTNSPQNYGYSKATFSIGLPETTPSDRSPSLKASSVVDLTGSQKSRDGDMASNRSESDSVSGSYVPEYRQTINTTRNGSATKKRIRRPDTRKLLSQQTPQNKRDTYSDDELREQEPPFKKRNGLPPRVACNTPFQLAKNPRRASEGISDGDLEQIDELATESKSAEKERSQRIELDAISDDDGRMSPITPGKRASADMSRINFSKNGGETSAPFFRLKRAVAAPKTLRVDALPKSEEPILRVDKTYTLIAVDSSGKQRQDYHWLEVKLNFCNEIQYTMGSPAIAVVKRAAKGGSPLVLEFAEPGDALHFGLWAQDSYPRQSALKLKITSSDSAPLQKTLDFQWGKAVGYKPRAVPDDLKYLENKETNSAIGTEQTLSRNAIRPSSSQQSTQYRSNATLRSGMTSAASASTSGSTKRTTSAYFDLVDETSGTNEFRRSTRQTQTRDTPTRPPSNTQPSRTTPKSPSPVPWMIQHPDWEDIWKDNKPLIFPVSGKHRTTVYKDDIGRLEEGEFMNDNLIGFYSRYLQAKLEEENKQVADRIYFMNTYFYPKLTEKRGRGINYDGVKTWTSKVDLFSYDYIIVPINEQAHWYLAIICHPSKLIKSDGSGVEESNSTPSKEPSKDGLVYTVGEQVEHMSLEDNKAIETQPETETSELQTYPAKPHTFVKKSSATLSRKKDPCEARVITLDSLAIGHSATCGNLKEYLVLEAKDKKKLEIEPPAQFGMTAKNIPEQLDHASCGAFLLYYMREFLRSPDEVVNQLVRKENPGWNTTSLEMRGELRSIIIEQRKEQNERNAKQAAERRAKKKSSSQGPYSSRSPEKELSGPPATPRTPTTVDDVPKKSSSTKKGNPTISVKSRSISPSKKAADGNIAVSKETRPPESALTVTGTAEEGNDGPPTRRSKPPDETKTPSLFSPPQRTQSSPVQVRSSPRHHNSKTTSCTKKMPADDQISAPSPEIRSAGKRGSVSESFKRSLTAGEQLLNQLSSPSKPMPIRSERRASKQHESSDSPSKQLISELQASPSKFLRGGDSASQEAENQAQKHASTTEDQEPSQNPSPPTMTAGHPLTSPHFAAPIVASAEGSLAKTPPVKSPSTRSPPSRPTSVRSSPASVKRLRQPSLEELLRPSVENAETHDGSPGSKRSKSQHHVTVDLTD